MAFHSRNGLPFLGLIRSAFRGWQEVHVLVVLLHLGGSNGQRPEYVPERVSAFKKPKYGRSGAGT